MKPRFGRIYQRGSTFWIAYHNGQGKEYRESTKSRRQGDAERLLKQRHAELLSGRFRTTPTVLVNELLDDLLRDYEINEKSSQWVKLVNNTHLRPFFGTLRADHVTTRTIAAFITHRRDKGIKNSTINRELSLLRRAYNLALQHDPPKLTAALRIPKLAEHNVRKGFFEHHEYQALLAAIPRHLKPVLTFAYYTGTRRGEILSLRWSQVDLDRKLVRLEPGETKNKDARLIPLTTELATTLTNLKTARDEQQPDNPWVFTYHGNRLKSFETAWVTACTTAGLVDHDKKPTKLFHDLRRTGVRNLVRAGVPELIAMKISGHKTRSVFDRYNVCTEDDLLAAATMLGKYLRP
jgi:integrase